MSRPFKIKTRSALVACLLASAIAMPAWSDTLILRNGTTVPGTLTGATGNTIMFRDRRGGMHRYSVRDVESVQFGDAPDDSRLSLIHISEPTRLGMISYAVFCLK